MFKLALFTTALLWNQHCKISNWNDNYATARVNYQWLCFMELAKKALQNDKRIIDLVNVTSQQDGF